MQTVLFATGLALFLLGLFTGFAEPAMKNPRMGLASHVEAHKNGLFLIVLGLLWPYVELSQTWEAVTVTLLLYGTWMNWLTTLLSGIWGAGGQMMRIASSDHIGSGVKERYIKFSLISLSIADILGVGLVLWGVLRP